MKTLFRSFDETLANSTVAGSQLQPNIAVLNDGSVLVTWASYISGEGYCVYAQKFSALGEKVGSEFITARGINHDYTPQIGATADGGFYVYYVPSSGITVEYPLISTPEPASTNISCPPKVVTSCVGFSCEDAIAPSTT